jgi:hypothetical protein
MMKYKLSNRRLKQANKMRCSSSSSATDGGDNTSIMETNKISTPVTLRDYSTFAPIENPTQESNQQMYPTVVSPMLPEQDPDYHEENKKEPPATPNKKRKYTSNINVELDSVVPFPDPSFLETVEQGAAVVLLGMRMRTKNIMSFSSPCWQELDPQYNSNNSDCKMAYKTIFSRSTSHRNISMEDSDDDSDMIMDLQSSSEERALVVHHPKPTKKKRKMDSEIRIIRGQQEKERTKIVCERKQLYKTIVEDSIVSSPPTSSQATTTTTTNTAAAGAATTPIKNNKQNGPISGLRLAVPRDPQYLNSLHCFVRAELLEVFCIPDLKSPATTGIHKPQRVGLRCVHCAHQKAKNSEQLVHKSRRSSATMCTFAPKSLVDMYRSVCTWQRLHFKSCPNIPQEVQEMYWKLKDADRTRGRKAHWIDSAKEMGLVDSADCHRGGIFWNPTSASLDPG